MMKKDYIKYTLSILSVLCLILSGCGKSEKSETESTHSSQQVQETSILEMREAFDESGTLWYIPYAEIESFKNPSLYSFADHLLVTDSVTSGELKLILLDSKSGEKIKSSTVEVSDCADVQVMDDHIVLCDSQTGTVTVLDSQLNKSSEYTVSGNDGQWFLGYDLDTLYSFSYENGLHTVSISTGEEQVLYALTELSVCDVRETTVCFTGVDRNTQKYTASCLDLKTGKVYEPPFSGDFFRLSHSGEMWLAGLYGRENTFVFGEDANAHVIISDNGTFSLVGQSGNILHTGFDGTLSLYDHNGVFLSSCELPGRYVQSIVWQEKLGGYLMAVNDSDDGNCILYWDVEAKRDGESLHTQTLSDFSSVPGGVSADASLYSRAQSISDRYGVEILIADQCETEHAYFSCYQISDYGPVSTGLDIIEEALAVFPENFFNQLSYGHIDHVQFQLVGGLNTTDGFGGDLSYAAFTDVDGSVCKIVMDIYTLSENAVWHELSHVIDRRLAWDAMYRDDAMFSEEGWSSLNPVGFAYTEEYGSYSTAIQPDWYSFFIDDYAMTNATEDRARIFEYAAGYNSTLFLYNPYLYAKLQYYSACIRDCFDTAQWPEVTVWEAVLQ